jgi:hypothetical protein
MKHIVTICVLLVLIAGTCSAASLTGAKNYGLSVDAGVLEIRTGTTLDYELTSDLFLTLDWQTRYSRVSRPLARYELSVNWYPDWLFLRGWCVSIGGAVRTEKAPLWFVEASTPWAVSIPKWLRFWEWWGKE